jgi:hypothetical protein
VDELSPEELELVRRLITACKLVLVEEECNTVDRVVKIIDENLHHQCGTTSMTVYAHVHEHSRSDLVRYHPREHQRR